MFREKRKDEAITMEGFLTSARVYHISQIRHAFSKAGHDETEVVKQPQRAD